jgi:serine/threonine-protein kinase
MSDSQQRYRVIEKLESGGMAEVFRAESEGLQGFRKQVAIKRVLPHLSSKTKFISMFLDEARLSAQLSHSNCVQVFDIGVGDNAYFIVMEFVDGANLKAVVEHLHKTGRDFPVEVAVAISLALCEGLAYAHELTDSSGVPLHIVHRDMSPPNVLITKHGEIKIVDFGLAKANSQLERSEPGIIKGKFSYLSPEAAMGQEVDARSDIFAVGIILWELLSGQRLFLGETDFQTVKKVQAAVVPSITQINKRVPTDLERIIVRALARERSQRYPNARSLGVDLSNFLFKYGVPVSSFDIETLVRGVMRDRQGHRVPQPSIIDRLIEEALLEFTSLTDDKAAPAPGAKPIDVPAIPTPMMPLNTARAYPASWIDDISRDARWQESGLSASLPAGLSEGNLAALEDDVMPPAGASAGTSGLSALLHGASSVEASKPAPIVLRPASQHFHAPARANALPVHAPERRSSAPLFVGILVALVVSMAAGAAAWFTRLIPHP